MIIGTRVDLVWDCRNRKRVKRRRLNNIRTHGMYCGMQTFYFSIPPKRHNNQSDAHTITYLFFHLITRKSGEVAVWIERGNFLIMLDAIVLKRKRERGKKNVKIEWATSIRGLQLRVFEILLYLFSFL